MHQRFDTNLSDPTPMGSQTKDRKHSRGPSFALKDLFRGDVDSDSEDRAPSVQSAPEEHDYYAITAYYGIEDDDAAGWDSRRSSMFGDYGRLQPRRQSKRVQEQSDTIKQMFEVDLTSKLQTLQSMEALDVVNPNNRISALSDTNNVASLFDDDLNNKNATINGNNNNNNKKLKTEDEDDNDILDKNESTVADLFNNESNSNEINNNNQNNNNPLTTDNNNNRLSQFNHNGIHSKRDTYSGVKALFGNKEIEDDEEEDADIDEDEYFDPDRHDENMRDIENMRLNPNLNKSKNVPRPSTNVALGSTFDSIAMIKDRVTTKDDDNKDSENEQDNNDKLNNNNHIIEAEQATVNNNYVGHGEQVRIRHKQEIEELQDKISQIQKEEQMRMDEIRETLQGEFDTKLKRLRQDIENDTDSRLRQELSISLRPKIEDECREKMKSEYAQKLENEIANRLNTEVESRVNSAVNELRESFDKKYTNLKTEMDEREEGYQKQLEIMAISKCQLIQHTSKEIDSLRQIIKDHLSSQ